MVKTMFLSRCLGDQQRGLKLSHQCNDEDDGIPVTGPATFLPKWTLLGNTIGISFTIDCHELPQEYQRKTNNMVILTSDISRIFKVNHHYHSPIWQKMMLMISYPPQVMYHRSSKKGPVFPGEAARPGPKEQHYGHVRGSFGEGHGEDPWALHMGGCWGKCLNQALKRPSMINQINHFKR